jgi:aspartate-semialdehyde dehydrogenase
VAKIPVGILGATGAVGQKFILQLADHPWFEIHALAASQRSAGQSYQDAANWIQSRPMPESVQDMIVKECRPDLQCKIAFSGLDSSVAGEIEQDFARAGHWVFSNAKNHRMDPDVPLVITELNPEHLEIIPQQQKNRGWKGAIITNANCSAVVLALSIGPLHHRFQLEHVHVVTMQAISGAGYPGESSLDILGNVVPFISGEEDKIETETQKILGTVEEKSFRPADFTVSSHANRVPVEEGHLECVSLTLKKKASVEEAIRCWEEFRGPSQVQDLPSAPQQPVIVVGEKNRPQPRRDVEKYAGMSAMVGRVRECPIFDLKYVVLGHNTIRGAAGASVMNAELAVQQGLIER